MPGMSRNRVTVNGRSYTWPARPLVVVCIDGSAPDYVSRAIDAGCMPFVRDMLARGADLRADAVMPTFTNPNNVSIITGCPPSQHGICGNYYYDPATGTEVMMNDPGLLRAPTILEAFAKAGASVAAVTAKDKLRRLLGHGLEFGRHAAVSVSAEQADRTSIGEHGIEDLTGLVGMPVPEVYSADLSEFVLAAGVALMRRQRPDIMYLSTTDYIQHGAEPGSEGANAFYAMMDRHFAGLDALGATLVLTADHGMSAKHSADGSINVTYLQDALDARFGIGPTRVILPITDPYVVHHGALGGYATVYLADGQDRDRVMQHLGQCPGVLSVYSREDACGRFSLPPDRIGDIVVVATAEQALGTTEAAHDLSALEGPLRSHGGLAEQEVPIYSNRPLTPPRRRLRNFDAFDLGLNAVAAG
ncbi:MAG: phosphonoacetate hydrolase [Alphaproteobacteria bacterium]|nr:phosphonoacetate hydrolase [Alphaproteobacteria bacterium]